VTKQRIGCIQDWNGVDLPFTENWGTHRGPLIQIALFCNFLPSNGFDFHLFQTEAQYWKANHITDRPSHSLEPEFFCISLNKPLHYIEICLKLKLYIPTRFIFQDMLKFFYDDQFLNERACSTNGVDEIYVQNFGWKA
jgi:hypothetical protein